MHKLDEEGNVTRLHMIVPTELIEKVNKWRAKQEGIPSRSAAIRELIELGLKVRH
jgi:metal-responsive CopG/Arc/MetJ family transcriptional regulator